MFELTGLELIAPAMFQLEAVLEVAASIFGKEDKKIEHLLMLIAGELAAIFFLLLGFFI